MKLTIFNVYVPMQDQAQCDRMKQVCVDNGLPIWHDKIAFIYFGECDNFTSSEMEGFFTACTYNEEKTQVTEAEFMNLLKEYKNENTN